MVGGPWMTLEDGVRRLVREGRLADAAIAVHRAAPTGGVNDDLLGLGAAAAYQSVCDDIALELFLRLDARRPLDADQWAMMGHAAERLGVVRVALPAYRRAAGMAPAAAPVHYNLGTLCLRRHDWPAALRHLRAACDLEPGWAAAWENLGQALLATENYEECLSFFAACIERFPGHASFREGRAAALLRKGDADAVDAYRALTKEMPANGDTWAGLVAALVQAGRAEEAPEVILAARSAGAWCVALTEVEATLKLESGDTEAAIRGYRAALAADPGYRQARINLIDALLQAGQAETALTLCDERLAALPGDPEMLAYKAIVLSDLGRRAEVAALLDPQLIKCHRPVCPEGYSCLGEFNRAVVDHILDHPSLVPAPPSHATVGGQHTGSLMCEPLGPMKSFKDLIHQAARSYRHRHGEAGHPFQARWSDEYSLTVWAVEMTAGAHQEPHIHPSGFLSGVYYPKIPGQAFDPSVKDGCIEFFRAPSQFALRHEPEIVVLPPEEGVMYLFPSAYFHRTIPFSGNGRRVSVAFDLVAL